MGKGGESSEGKGEGVRGKVEGVGKERREEGLRKEGGNKEWKVGKGKGEKKSRGKGRSRKGVK